MTAPARAPLYTPDLLHLAVSLADWPIRPAMTCIGEARSRTCGSTMRIALATDQDGGISDVGMQVSACAVGQAAAALFAKSVRGASAGTILQSREAIMTWLAEGGIEPWPGFALLEPARVHSPRHGAITLPWDAALAALSKAEARG